MSTLMDRTIRRMIIRDALPSDRQLLSRLLFHNRHAHIHKAWRPALDWLGEAPGYIAETPGGLVGFLITPVDVLPTAWIRAAAVSEEIAPEPVLFQLFKECLKTLDEKKVISLNAMPVESWLPPILQDLGFTPVEWVESWTRTGTITQPRGNQNVSVRFARPEDLVILAAIDAVSFEPRWQHSVRSLMAALDQAHLFTVAELEGELVGFQVSLVLEKQAHLARLSVHPSVQGQGVGTRLLADTMAQYRALDLDKVSLNTQTENQSSHRLYESFGFKRDSPPLAVWERPIQLLKDLQQV